MRQDVFCEERLGTSFTVESGRPSYVLLFNDAAGQSSDVMNDGERIRSFEYDYACGGKIRPVTVDGEVQGTLNIP